MTITVKRPEGIVEFCADLALRADWENANQHLTELRRNPSDRMGDPELSAAVTKVQDLQTQMQDATLLFRIQGLPRKRWQELGVEHPAREDNAIDAPHGVDTSVFFDLVAKEPGCILAVNEKVTGAVVDFDPVAEWDELADEMTNAAYGEFVTKFLELNRGTTAVPFSRTALALTKPSEPTSKPQPSSE